MFVNLQAWPLSTKEPKTDGGGTGQGGWQVTAYRGLRGAPAGAGALLPLGTAAPSLPLLRVRGTAHIRMLNYEARATTMMMPAAYCGLVTRLARSVSPLRVSLLTSHADPVCSAVY